MNYEKTSLSAAKKRVKELKGYYSHIVIFIVVNGFLYLLRLGAANSLLPDGFPKESFYYDWINGNILIWGLILVMHTLLMFRHKVTFFKKWEERQIQKYMDEDRNKVDKYK